MAPFHAHAYDGANIIFNAIEKVAIKSGDGTLLIPRKALAAAMIATKDHQGDHRQPDLHGHRRLRRPQDRCLSVHERRCGHLEPWRRRGQQPEEDLALVSARC